MMVGQVHKVDWFKPIRKLAPEDRGILRPDPKAHDRSDVAQHGVAYVELELAEVRS